MMPFCITYSRVAAEVTRRTCKASSRLSPPPVGGYFVNERLTEQLKLPPGGPLKCCDGKIRAGSFDAGLAAGDLEHGFDLFGENPFAGHPRLEAWVVQLAAPNRADAVKHFFFPDGEVPRQPLLEQRGNCIRQTQDDVTGEL